MLKTIDLFAGAGGLSLGFEMTGRFEILATAENNPYARATYLANLGKNDIEVIEDVRNYNFKELAKKLGGIDVVIGGPPCQGFSNANRQKNHIISQNNSLVKEYFRAIREIRPCAFVMENVSMLSSETHRFYDSAKDHDEVASLDIPMRKEKLVIADENYDGLDCFSILKAESNAQYRIDEDLLQLLNVLYKDRNNEERFTKFLLKHGKHLVSLINNLQEIRGDEIKILRKIAQCINNNEGIYGCMDDLGRFIKFQKSFQLIDELNQNEIMYNLILDSDTGRIFAEVESYAVIDYVKKILGDSYLTESGVINSLWFGVPQERKRFIMMGIRKDDAEVKIRFPSASDYKGVKQVSVGEAISDLAGYHVVDKLSDMCTIPYYDQALSDYEYDMRKGSSGVSNHIGPKTRELAKKRFASLHAGENFHKLDPDLKANYTDPGRTQNSIYMRLDPDKPSGTVTNVRKAMWIHPFLNRAISVREAARLQSFPDRFIFKGTKDAQYQQVGNAVPPLMAKGIAECLLRNIK
jgi:DNA (cytosine-5)-methyltransferase 1